MIRQVECLGAELDRETLGDAGVFEDSHIQDRLPGSEQDVASQSAESERGGSGEIGGIEPLCNRLIGGIQAWAEGVRMGGVPAGQGRGETQVERRAGTPPDALAPEPRRRLSMRVTADAIRTSRSVLPPAASSKAWRLRS